MSFLLKVDSVETDFFSYGRSEISQDFPQESDERVSSVALEALASAELELESFSEEDGSDIIWDFEDPEVQLAQFRERWVEEEGAEEEDPDS
jgi:hypothetical protein